MHGKTSRIHHDGKGVFRNLANPFEATRYHSLVIQPDTLPAELQVVAWTDQGEIMGVRHTTWPLHGVQFHPESFLTLEGIKLLRELPGVLKPGRPARSPERPSRDHSSKCHPMLTVEEALALVLKHAKRLPACRCFAKGVAGAVAWPRISWPTRINHPSTKALVDGYAVRSADLGEREIAGCSQARRSWQGSFQTGRWDRGEAAVIMTGAPLPAEADAVVMHEHTRRADDQIVIEEPRVQPGQNLLPRGRIYQANDRILSAGASLSPTCLALLASVGHTRVAVIPRPVVGILSTGDELVEPDQVPGPGQIRNSNAIMLEALVVDHGGTPLSFADRTGRAQAARFGLEQGLDADMLVITGGVSAGQRDLVPAVLAELGVSQVFHKIRLKPGKPLWFGIGPERPGRPGPLVFGLPGNPVSGLVGFLLFVQPALRILAGDEGVTMQPWTGRLTASFVHRGDRPTYHPARWRNSGNNQAADG